MVAAQVFEHLDAGELDDGLALMQRKLAPGGGGVMEAVNPRNPVALKALRADPAHRHPLFPEVLLSLCRLVGFDSGDVGFAADRCDVDVDVYPTSTMS